MAVGLDPEVCTLFVQSHVREHAELGWIMQCNVSYGELSRMTQFKDKSGQHDFISAGLFTYPALQAADILLYDTDEVPVGDDQRQHIEITRDIAERFNSHYGETFVLPEAVIPPPVPASWTSNSRPRRCRSRSTHQGHVGLLDEPKQIEKKIKSRHRQRRHRPFRCGREAGVSNLLSILGAATDRDPASLPTSTSSTARSRRTRLPPSSNCSSPCRPAIATGSRSRRNRAPVEARGRQGPRDRRGTMERVRTNVGLLTD